MFYEKRKISLVGSCKDRFSEKQHREYQTENQWDDEPDTDHKKDGPYIVNNMC